MTIHICREGCVLPVSTTLIELLKSKMYEHKLNKTQAVTFNFRDPNYSPTKGGYHPVEIRLEKKGDAFEFIYITDFSFQGNFGQSELVKELDFDFVVGVVQLLYVGIKPIEEAKDIFKIWQDNFIFYCNDCDAFEVELSLD